MDQQRVGLVGEQSTRSLLQADAIWTQAARRRKIGMGETTARGICSGPSCFEMSITFSSQPDDELLRKLKSVGLLFDRDRWFRTQSESSNASHATIDQSLGA